MKRIIYSILILAIIIQGLCSCSRQEEKEEEAIVLTVLAGQSTTDAGIEDMIDDWLEEKYPNVKLEWECVDWGNRFASQMQGRLAAGNIPDIMVGKVQNIKAYASTGQLGVISEKSRGQIEESALEAVSLNGCVYGMPYNSWYQGVIYNKNIFKSQGIKPPSTLKELDIVIEKLQSAGIVPFASHFQESWSVANMTMQQMINTIFKNEPGWGDSFRSGGTDCTGNKKVISCFLNNKKILKHSWKDAMQIDQFESDNRFMQGKAAMYLTGSWTMQFASQYGQDTEFGIFPFPNKDGNPDLIHETNLTFMKSANTKYEELIDSIFYELQNDKKLLWEILEFTQSSPAVKGMEPGYVNKIQNDIDKYIKEGRITDASQGNSQLIWDFQNDAAKEQICWLKKEKTLDAVLEYMDKNRENSMYGGK